MPFGKWNEASRISYDAPVSTIVRAENLGKRYRIGQVEPYRTLREAIAASAWAPIHMARWAASQMRGGHRRADRTDAGHIWALKGLRFEFEQGDVVGIIGRNGAGKSTLLKILARITEPTTGWFELRGRVSSLLEVGTGFHAELSGRENIYLNGAILGMRRREIERKFDEIVAFAEVQKFVDTPLKHYSSGMQARLAFAVAAHLEPEILLVDEVLAVGDLGFQKKCLGKMGDVSRQGRTVLFVSHNMAAIEALCRSCLLLAEGELVISGTPSEVVHKYVSSEIRCDVGKQSLVNHSGREPNSRARMTSVEIHSASRSPTGTVRMGAPVSVRVVFRSDLEPFHPHLGVVVKNAQGQTILTVNDDFLPGFDLSRPVESGTVVCDFDWMPLMPGTYSLDLYLGANIYADIDIIRDAVSFEVLPADVFGTGKLPEAAWGMIFWPARWRLEPECPQGEPASVGQSDR
jgi:lipopolysaccharide transport system ATP-binding protein